MAGVIALVIIIALVIRTNAIATKIMPLGDSITEWQCNNESQGGYSNYLGQHLAAGKVPFDFVGSKYGCGNHEGHSGWTIEQLEGIAEGVLSTHQPDIILIQAGTNDLFFNQPGYPQGTDVNGCLT